MIKANVFYTYEEGKKFDMDYYLNSHLPMVHEKLGGAIKGGGVVKGLNSGKPGSPPIYAVISYLLFDSVEAFQNSFGPHSGAIMADIPNFTDLRPKIQISEVKM